MESDLDLDLLSASLRADLADLDAFVEGLAAKLEEAVPSGVAIERRRSGLMGPKVVRRISVELGGERLELRVAEGHRLETVCARVSGGIVLKTEPVDTDVWLAALGEGLAAEAARSQTTRRALERLLIG
jgi:hypothetical protein